LEFLDLWRGRGRATGKDIAKTGQELTTPTRRVIMFLDTLCVSPVAAGVTALTAKKTGVLAIFEEKTLFLGKKN
jgi:hypothetical protein